MVALDIGCTMCLIKCCVVSEVLREGDELLEVNGIPIMSRSTDEIVTMMVSV